MITKLYYGIKPGYPKTIKEEFGVDLGEIRAIYTIITNPSKYIILTVRMIIIIILI